MEQNTETKRCNTCNEVKDIKSFNLRNDTGKRRPNCNSCKNAPQKEYQKAYRKQWRADNPDYQKNWHKNNPGYMRAALANLKAAELGCDGKLPANGWEALLDFYGKKCMHPECESEEELTIDHVVPLTSKGLNSLANTQILCRSHNSSKGTKTTDYRDHSKGILVDRVSG